MKKIVVMALLLGSFFYVQHGWTTGGKKQQKGLQSFHKKIKRLFDEKKFHEVTSQLEGRLKTSIPPKLTRSYRKLIQLAKKLQSKKELAPPIPSGLSFSAPPISTAPPASPEGSSSAPISDNGSPTVSAGKYKKWKAYLRQHPQTKQARNFAQALVVSARRRGDETTEQMALSSLFFSMKSSAQKEKIRRELDRLNQKLIFSPKATALAQYHTVRPGEYLSRIAGKYNCPWEFIVKINGLRGPQIRVGQRLKILGGRWEIRVKKSAFTLTVLLNGFYIKQYKIGLGKGGCTPSGVFEIRTKQKKPAWYWKGRRYPYGNPKNILGTRWMGFKNTAKYSGYGIHGTSRPWSIGKEESSGCVRMRNREVEELYRMIPRKTKVTITK